MKREIIVKVIINCPEETNMTNLDLADNIVSNIDGFDILDWELIQEPIAKDIE